MTLSLNDTHYQIRKRILKEWVECAREYCEPKSTMSFSQFALHTAEAVDALPLLSCDKDAPKEMIALSDDIQNLKHAACGLPVWLEATRIACAAEAKFYARGIVSDIVRPLVSALKTDILLLSATPVALSPKMSAPVASPREIMSQTVANLGNLAETYETLSDREPLSRSLVAATTKRVEGLRPAGPGS